MWAAEREVDAERNAYRKAGVSASGFRKEQRRLHTEDVVRAHIQERADELSTAC